MPAKYHPDKRDGPSPGDPANSRQELRQLQAHADGLRHEGKDIDNRIHEIRKMQSILLKAQHAEYVEHNIYHHLTRLVGDQRNREVLKALSQEKLDHYHFWKRHTGLETIPPRWKITAYAVLARILGLTFVLRLMENREVEAEHLYRRITRINPEMTSIKNCENGHKDKLRDILGGYNLEYASSVVLGLNDALVELTGAIAGFSLALQQTQIIAITSLVTGFSASLSMAGSEYLSTKTATRTAKNPLRAAFYTGVTYILATLILVAPFFFTERLYLALGWTIGHALLLIFMFNFYISIAKRYSFKKRFGQMAAISLSVMAISFMMGYAMRFFFDIRF